MASSKLISLVWSASVLIGCGNAGSNVDMVASGGAADASGGAADDANGGAVIVEGDKGAAIAAVGDAQRLLMGFDHGNTDTVANQLKWLSSQIARMVGPSAGDPIVRDRLIDGDAVTSSASCNRVRCEYSNYLVIVGDGNVLVFTGDVVRSTDRTTVTVDMSWVGTGYNDSRLTASFNATQTLLDGWVEVRSTVVEGFTVDTLRFNEVTLSDDVTLLDPPQSGSVELDRIGPRGHYQASFTFP